RLPSYITEFERPSRDAIAIGNDWSRAIFDVPFYVSPSRQSSRPPANLVFVQSLDGNTAGNPSALGGGETDKHLVYEGLSRGAADAVMAGAGTVRGGQNVFYGCDPGPGAR